MPKIAIISDTHGRLHSDAHGRINNIKIPDCDILISAGDYSFQGYPGEVQNFHEWLNEQPAQVKISVQGNHERHVERNFMISKEIAQKACPGAHFLAEGLVETHGLKIWCSAMSPSFCDWAYNRDRGSQIKKHWDMIPDDTDVLITHGPPMGILDFVENDYHIGGEHVGCEDLLNRIKELKNLKVHAFGHIHCGYGHLKTGNVDFYNAAICNEAYEAVNAPFVINL